jgi:CheY-like chemotaxis protein
MGGQIGFRSTLGRGSSFWVVLSLEIHAQGDTRGRRTQQTASLPRKPSGRDADQADDGSLEGPTVLLGEADPFRRTMAEMLLSRAGCLIDLAGSGDEALALLDKRDYALVLLGVETSPADRARAVESARRRAGEAGRRPPIVVVYNGSTSGGPDSGKVPSDDVWIAGPLTPETLMHTLQECLPAEIESPADSPEPVPGPTGIPEPPRRDDLLRSLREALAQRDFHHLERSACALKDTFLDAEHRSAADHAMRILLAARSNNLQRAAVAVDRLQAAMGVRRSAELAPIDNAQTCP